MFKYTKLENESIPSSNIDIPHTDFMIGGAPSKSTATSFEDSNASSSITNSSNNSTINSPELSSTKISSDQSNSPPIYKKSTSESSDPSSSEESDAFKSCKDCEEGNAHSKKPSKTSTVSLAEFKKQEAELRKTKRLSRDMQKILEENKKQVEENAKKIEELANKSKFNKSSTKRKSVKLSGDEIELNDDESAKNENLDIYEKAENIIREANDNIKGQGLFHTTSVRGDTNISCCGGNASQSNGKTVRKMTFNITLMTMMTLNLIGVLTMLAETFSTSGLTFNNNSTNS